MLEAILRSFCAETASTSHEVEQKAVDPLALLQQEYPDLKELVTGKTVLDFGCGEGRQAIALRRRYQADVTGLDTNAGAIKAAKANDTRNEVTFVEALSHDQKFDVIISQNAMEHFPDPEAVLRFMSKALKPGGKILVTFGPPWYSPMGSHMNFFCRVPWVNLLFPERVVMKVRARYRNDGAKRYEEVESGLNKMSLAKFDRTVKASGLMIASKHYRCVKRFDFLGKIPVLKELFVNRVTADLVIAT